MYDVIVVGAGPAGSAAAWSLGNKGFNVLLIDKNKFPRDKPCGGWITPDIFNLIGLNYDDLRKKIFASPFATFHNCPIAPRCKACNF